MLKSLGIERSKEANLRVVSEFLVTSSVPLGGSNTVKLIHIEAGPSRNGKRRRGGVERPLSWLQAGRKLPDEDDEGSGRWVPDPFGTSLVLGTDACSSVAFNGDSSALTYEVMLPGNGRTNVVLRLDGQDTAASPEEVTVWQQGAHALAVRYKEVRGIHLYCCCGALAGRLRGRPNSSDRRYAV